MNNFNLHTPTRILFGKGAIAGLREQIPHDARVLITYGGGSVKKTGVLAQVLDALKGMDVLEFGGIEPNPAYETLMNAVKLVREKKSLSCWPLAAVLYWTAPNLSPLLPTTRKTSIRGTSCKRAVKRLKAPFQWAAY